MTTRTSVKSSSDGQLSADGALAALRLAAGRVRRVGELAGHASTAGAAGGTGAAERAIGDIAGSLRRLAQRDGSAARETGPAGLQARVAIIRSEILGTRGSSTPAAVRQALSALLLAAGPAARYAA